jgi:DUF1680 family protein
VALVRGPLVFAVEQADLPDGVVLEDVGVDPSAPVGTVMHGGDEIPVTLRARGAVRPNTPEDLYRDYADDGARPAPVDLTAIPYFLWGNRAPGPMRVWLPIVPSSTNRKELR